MSHKPIDEKISSLDEKIKFLTDQKKQLQAQAKSKERKERTRRLIQIGAIFDSIGISTPDAAEKFKIAIQSDKKIIDIINNIKKNKDSV